MNIHIRPRLVRCICGEKYTRVSLATKFYKEVASKLEESEFKYSDKR